jgi:hypothetical protein
MIRGSIGISCAQHDTQQRAEQQQWTTFVWMKTESLKNFELI